jgi:toxin YoeB
VTFVSTGRRDYMFWQNTDRAIVKRINRLIDDIGNGDPFEGIGKPEPLRHHLAGAWSRRITHEHRLVYTVSADRAGDDVVTIIACHCRYEK